MVPFYGQGLNCGLEDVRILAAMLLSKGLDLSVSSEPQPLSSEDDEELKSVFEEYTRTRHADVVAICDLAMENYVEMRHSVTTLRYRTRRIIDRILSRVFPSPSATHTPLELARATTTHVKTASSPAPGATVPLSSHLSRDYPGGWISLYTMVTFRPDIPYALAKMKAEWQDGVISRAMWCLGLGLGSGLIFAISATAHTLSKRRRP